MLIEVAAGTGFGATGLTAFDAALAVVGLEDVNIVRLSSVIPPGSQVRRVRRSSSQGRVGDRLYCVVADAVGKPGDDCWAGLGWCQDVSGAGVFLEHHGASEDEVKSALADGLADMKRLRADREWSEPEFELAGLSAHDSPVAAAVVAVYQREGWLP